MIKFKDILNESVKVSTFKGDYINFSKDDIKQMIDGKIDIYSDNLPKWLYMGVINSRLSKKNQKTAIIKILKDMFDDKIKKVDFSRNSKGDIVGLKNIDINKYK